MNEQTGNSFTDIATAIGMLGLSVAASVVLTPIAGVIAGRLLTSLMAIGYGDTLVQIINMIEDNGGAAQRQSVLDKMRTSGGKMSVYTNFYEYSTASGNSYTHYTATNYSWVA